MPHTRLIEIEFKDGRRGRVAPRALNILLREGRVAGFQRDDNWVRVGIDRTREKGMSGRYRGVERRARGPFCFYPDD